MAPFDAFKKGLKEKYDMEYNEILSWKYAGGNDGRHFRYWTLKYKDLELPENENKCVCGHDIKDNCYITNDKGTELMVLGSCCIKAFIPNCKRNCDTCGKPHQNRVVDRCNICRIGRCDKCGNKCKVKYACCYNCHNTNLRNKINIL